MCLLVSQPEGTVFDDEFLFGVYTKNSDGIGVMYADNNKLNILRCVPTTYEDFKTFFKTNIEGKACAWHARMRTHGDIDLTNCHPYQVISGEEGYPLYLAHNGVLSFGNASDTSKSDTWHYIQNTLRPLLLKNPEFFLTDAFRSLIESHIGSGNKFVLMDAYGNSVTINERAGVQHNGAWLSNTYAWDTAGTKYDFRSKPFAGFSSYARFVKSTNDEDEESLYGWPNNLLSAPTDDEIEVEIESEKDEYDKIIDYAVEFFATCRDVDIDPDLAWGEVEDYYVIVGHELAWDVVECIRLGAYTEEEIEKEVLSYLEYDDDYEEETQLSDSLLAKYGANAANDVVAA